MSSKRLSFLRRLCTRWLKNQTKQPIVTHWGCKRPSTTWGTRQRSKRCKPSFCWGSRALRTKTSDWASYENTLHEGTAWKWGAKEEDLPHQLCRVRRKPCNQRWRGAHAEHIPDDHWGWRGPDRRDHWPDGPSGRWWCADRAAVRAWLWGDDAGHTRPAVSTGFVSRSPPENQWQETIKRVGHPRTEARARAKISNLVVAMDAKGGRKVGKRNFFLEFRGLIVSSAELWVIGKQSAPKDVNKHVNRRTSSNQMDIMMTIYRRWS